MALSVPLPAGSVSGAAPAGVASTKASSDAPVNRLDRALRVIPRFDARAGWCSLFIPKFPLAYCMYLIATKLQIHICMRRG